MPVNILHGVDDGGKYIGSVTFARGNSRRDLPEWYPTRRMAKMVLKQKGATGFYAIGTDQHPALVASRELRKQYAKDRYQRRLDWLALKPKRKQLNAA